MTMMAYGPKEIADKLHAFSLENEPGLVFHGYGDIKTAKIPDVSEAMAMKKAAFAKSILLEAEKTAATPLCHADEILLDIIRFRCNSLINEHDFYWNIFVAEPWFNMVPMIFSFLGRYPLDDDEYLNVYIRCLDGLSGLVRQHRGKTKMQAEKGIRLPRAILPYAVQTYRSCRIDPDAHPLLLTREKLEGLNTDADKSIHRSKAAIDAMNAALAEMTAFLEGSYKDAAPKSVGYHQYPNGPEYYRAMIKQHTTLDLTPEKILELGEMHRKSIEGQMAAIRKSLGFDLSGSAFAGKVMADPTRIMKTPEEFEKKLNSYIDRIRPVLKDYFHHQPKAECSAKRIDPELEPLMHNGYYNPPSPGDPKGYYYYNGLNMDKKNPMKTASLAYHELLPGHHFQIALTLENEALHPLAKKGRMAAYIEGWAEYAAALAGEMGMYDDLYDEYGRLEMDLYLTNFMTIDAGLNTGNKTLEEMMDFMGPYLPDFTEERLLSQLLRSHFSIPGFVSSYKMGHLKFQEIRDKAQQALGEKFDIKAFHQVVLEWGPVPLGILEKHVDWWVAQQTDF